MNCEECIPEAESRRALYRIIRTHTPYYRGISLLSVVGKVFARVALTKQCGFRTGRSTIDMIFSVRQLQEKCPKQRRPLFTAFIDLTKAFDLVSRRWLLNLLEKIGCPRNYRVWCPSITTWREKSTATEQHPNRSRSTVELNRDEFWHRHYLAYPSPLCYHMPIDINVACLPTY